MRTIDADVLKRKVQRLATEAWKMQVKASVETILNQFIDYIDHAPTVDAVPVKHGRWKCSDKYENAVCSVCGYDTGEAYGFGCGNGCYNFCPMCGADMRKDDDNGQTD